MKVFVLIFCVFIIKTNANSIESSDSNTNSLESSDTNIKICSNDNEMIEHEYSTYVNVLTNISCEYDKLTIDLHSTIRNFTQNIQKKIEMFATEMSSVINKVNRISKPEFHVDIISLIRQGEYCAGNFQLIKNGQSFLRKLIPMVYAKNLTNAEKLIEFFNIFDNIDDRIYALRLLFDEMKLNGHMFSTVTTSIAYQVFNIFHLTSENNEHYIYLRDNLPVSLKRFPWNDVNTITNLISQEILFSVRLKYDDKRRHCFSYNDSCTDDSCQWKFSTNTNGTYFNIKNIGYSEYLFADENEYAEDNQRHRVFLWTDVKGETLETGRWQFEAIEGSDDYFKIKNLYLNEYIILDTFKPGSSRFFQFFTYGRGDCEVDKCKWKFTPV